MFYNFAKLLMLLSVAVSAATGTEYFATPDGRSQGAGTMDDPWDLRTALNRTSVVRAGDVVWVRGGDYKGSWVSTVSGSLEAPVIIRNFPGERARLDGANTNTVTLIIKGSNVWFWGLEVYNSNPQRAYPADLKQPGREAGVHVFAPNSKLINMIIHDTGQGVGFWSSAANSEIYGCIIFYNGQDRTDYPRGVGHGIYSQNGDNGSKSIVDNIIFRQYGLGVQIYGSSSAPLRNFYIEGNTIFDNGGLSATTAAQNLLIGGNQISQNNTVVENMLYDPIGPRTRQGNLTPCYQMGCTGLILRDNYVAGNVAVHLEKRPTPPFSATGNTFIGSLNDLAPDVFRGPVPDGYTLEDNTLLSSPPSRNRIFVRQNRAESNRAQVTVYNWEHLARIPLDLSGFLSPGDHYVIQDVTDLFGDPVAEGTAGDDGIVTVNIDDPRQATPVGRDPIKSLWPEFGVFIVTKQVLPPATSEP